MSLQVHLPGRVLWFGRPMCRPNAGEALGLGFDHRTKVVAAVGALLLQVEPDRGQVFLADRLGEQGAILADPPLDKPVSQWETLPP